MKMNPACRDQIEMSSVAIIGSRFSISLIIEWNRYSVILLASFGGILFSNVA